MIKMVPLLERTFRRRKRPVGKSSRTDKILIRVKGEMICLYRAVDKVGKG
jgi:putative transposase